MAYLDLFRIQRFKERIDRVRHQAALNGPLWCAFGLLVESNAKIEWENNQGTSEPTKYSPERNCFARDAKEVSNFFDYLGSLLHAKHIDRELLFQQIYFPILFDWWVLRPFIYFERLRHCSKFALGNLAYYEAAVRNLDSRAAPADVVAIVRKGIADATKRSKQKSRAERLKETEIWFDSEDTQRWFEWLYLQACKWVEMRVGKQEDWMLDERGDVAATIAAAGAHAPPHRNPPAPKTA